MRKLFLYLCLIAFTLYGYGQDTFTGSFIMTMTNRVEQASGEVKETESKIHYFIKKDKMAMKFLQYSGTPGVENMRTIIDNNEKVMYTLMEQGGQKRAIKVAIPEDQQTSDESATNKDAEVTVTDETKEIQGYPCTKVIIVDDDNKTISWVAENEEMSNAQIFSYTNQKSPMSGGSQTKNTATVNEVPVQGWPLETIVKDKASGELVYKYFITDIQKGNVPDKVFDLSGYQVMDMSKLRQQYQNR